MKSLTPETQLAAESSNADELIIQSLAKLDQTALGISIGILFGAVIFLATNILVIKGGEQIGPNLFLLSQYFIGYEVTFYGSLIGAVYGFMSGFVLGWLIAFLRNAVTRIYLFIVKLKGSVMAVNDFIDNP